MSAPSDKAADLPVSDVDKESPSGSSLTTESDRPTDDKPKHVSSKLWERFKALEKRTDDITRRSTEKRVQHLRKKITETVKEHSDVLKSAESGTVTDTSVKIQDKTSDQSAEKESDAVKQWKDVKQYLDINKHLDAGRSTGQTHLEHQIEEAIKKGDYSTADKLSDQLSNREFGSKIAQAFDARDFLKRKKETEAINKDKKKKKLNWGFEQKERWETKSNM